MSPAESTRVKDQQGFTLIELVVVIAVLAILAAVALPRFADIAEEAHSAAIEGASGALSAAVVLTRSQWLAIGSPGATLNLPGYGDETVDVSIAGWPTGSNGNTNPDGMNAAECVGIWGALLQANAPSVSTTTGDDYLASINGGNCRYVYQLNANGSYIEYDPNSGEVTTTLL
ncbi:prepilin-type N-terminal cleavage/methylation domain-containing protein [Oleiphilus messinensis]|uniref:prepilin-type N-terminal cleavage/methylation domain-containing protein n=1 Tax=Oleiphilus messinensis TaxID=141451 RepID=UPI000B3B170F|nr:prepilin-type N-terminal cleavage/methylation domain-containing protein [Oleiphilus messinensis]